MNEAKRYSSMTIKADGLIRSIVSEAEISEAFNLENPPDPHLPRKSVKALWDTGASKSVISEEAAKELNLPISGKVEIVHANGKDDCNQHFVNIYLPSGVNIVGLQVAATKLSEIDVLIGMDIITLGDFALTNKNDRSMFSFRVPSNDEIDYVEQDAATMSKGLGRNEPCWCGSGKKYKLCHGKTIV
ncbi:MAG: SEC-C metal-binding domain-containing protein [Coriobacteriia bacterium]|nr:SEC-C metal-binding domain-containing protein [Coriobacteriia bacterium]